MTSSKLGKGIQSAPASSVHKMTTRSSKEGNTSSQQPKDSKPTKTKAASEKEDEELKPEYINKDGRTYTPLIRAICANDTERVLFLLSNGADVNTKHNETIDPVSLRKRHDASILRHPLDFAASYCNPELFQLLLSHGADISLSNPLHAVTSSRNPAPEVKKLAMLDYLLDTLKLDINAMEFAGDEDAKEQFRRQKELRGENGIRAFGTPLHKAAGWGWEGGVRYLLGRGADRGIVDTEEVGTPVDWAKGNDVESSSFDQGVVDLLTQAE